MLDYNKHECRWEVLSDYEGLNFDKIENFEESLENFVKKFNIVDFMQFGINIDDVKHYSLEMTMTIDEPGWTFQYC